MNKFIQLLKPRVVFIIPCFLAIMATSCTPEIDLYSVFPEIELSQEENDLQIIMGETIHFSATTINEAVYTEEWYLGDKLVSSEAAYAFIPEKSGTYVLSYAATNNAGAFTNKYTILVDAKIRPITTESNLYVTSLIDYLPAPGQFINTTLGSEEGAKTVEGKKGMVSLGGWGGSVSYAFDHTVINTADSNDLIVYGNAMSNFAEPGIVWVMQDENANGIADDTWYEIKGSADELDGTIKNYSVTYTKPEPITADVPWTDSEGNSGVVATNVFHKQAYYPASVTEDSYTITGTILSSSNIDMSNPRFITSAPFDAGYADNTPGGDKIDIAMAIDEDGNMVNLTGIDFIKVQTAIQANMGWLGELSTEVTGIADLSLL
ncbi:PKD-like domain-containing protein [Polaribacter sp. ALD11]|uniref:PKD-like domain-containing protein n=1 Tax=Polaribacter sp. ALD11 TaxID=2058137 RepID=UPI0018E27173|nr:PKD-like domain-containing protein [Polaribacter sp. ALD11]